MMHRVFFIDLHFSGITFLITFHIISKQLVLNRAPIDPQLNHLQTHTQHNFFYQQEAYLSHIGLHLEE